MLRNSKGKIKNIEQFKQYFKDASNLNFKKQFFNHLQSIKTTPTGILSSFTKANSIRESKKSRDLRQKEKGILRKKRMNQRRNRNDS